MIKFADLSNATLAPSMMEVLRSGRFIDGPYNKLFSQMWAQECGADYCTLTSSGTSALIAALKAVMLPNRDLVIMPALSFAATAFAAMECGLMPAYVDVDEHGLMRWDQVEELCHKFSARVAAIMPVHLYGQVVSVPESLKYVIIHDACQAHGAFKLISGMACFSFYPSKNLGAIGDAGAVVCNSEGLNRRIAAYCNYGDYPGEKYKHNFQGNNLRCDEIQAAYLSLAYRNLEADNLKRRLMVDIYEAGGVVSLANSKPSSHHLYPILVDNPGLFRKVMIDYGVETGNHYPYALPQVASGYMHFECGKAEYIAQHVVTLPLGPHMTFVDANRVVEVMNDVMELRDDGLWYIKEHV